MSFTTPNRLNQPRADSFATKEPETIEWIDGLPEACTLWDIGANVGLYSVYAAKKEGAKMWLSSRPSLTCNDWAEPLSRKITESGKNRGSGVERWIGDESDAYDQNRLGGLSSFGQDFGWGGKSIAPTLAFQNLGISMDEVVSLLRFIPLNFIKMDVDGIEHIILHGDTKVLT